jgi:hypothetical protein
VTSVARISPTPDTLPPQPPDEVPPGRDSVTGNLPCVDGDGRRLRSSRTAWPAVVSADDDPAAGVLR